MKLCLVFPIKVKIAYTGIKNKLRINRDEVILMKITIGLQSILSDFIFFYIYIEKTSYTYSTYSNDV